MKSGPITAVTTKVPFTCNPLITVPDLLCRQARLYVILVVM